MAKKAAPDSASMRGFNDIIGIVLMGSAILLLIALLSYDAHDLPQNTTETNHSAHNLIGPIGAHIAYYCLLWVGVSAYVLPFILVFLGLGCFFEPLAYVRRRWSWTAVLFVCCMGLFDLHESHFPHPQSPGAKVVKATSVWDLPGRVLGKNLDQHFFLYFGRAGATILFMMLIFISLLFLTNFQLGDWLRGFWGRKAAVAGTAGNGEMTPEERALEKRARELEKQARKLQEQVDKAGVGLGADMKPVPEPTVRDLSIHQGRPGASRSKKPVEPVKEPAPPDEGVVIPAREVVAATSAVI